MWRGSRSSKHASVPAALLHLAAVAAAPTAHPSTPPHSTRTFGSATLASQRRPSIVCSTCSAAAAAPASANVTKPKPLDLPLRRSFMMSVASTSPYWLKCSRRVSSLCAGQDKRQQDRGASGPAPAVGAHLRGPAAGQLRTQATTARSCCCLLLPATNATRCQAAAALQGQILLLLPGGVLGRHPHHPPHSTGGCRPDHARVGRAALFARTPTPRTLCPTAGRAQRASWVHPAAAAGGSRG